MGMINTTSRLAGQLVQAKREIRKLTAENNVLKGQVAYFKQCHSYERGVQDGLSRYDNRHHEMGR